MEKQYRPLPFRRFLGRLSRNAIAASVFVGISLAIGVWGYSYFEHMALIDAFLNAAMILGGMGPVDRVVTSGGKIFAGCYALFSGVILLFSATVLLAPVALHVLHLFHLTDEKEEEKNEDKGKLKPKN